MSDRGSAFRRSITAFFLGVIATAALAFLIPWPQKNVPAARTTPSPLPQPARLPDAPPRGPTSPDELVVWRPVFIDNFDRNELGDAWEIVHGDWKLQNGRLVIAQPSPQSIILCRGVEMSGDLQIAYRCRTTQGYRGNACDMSVMTHAPHDKPLKGYLWRFGSYENTWSGLCRQGKTLAQRHDIRIRPNQVHTVLVQSLDGRLTMLVDDQVVCSFRDAAALDDPALIHGGFYVYASVVEFDEIVISRPVRLKGELEPKPATPGKTLEPLPEDAIF